ncbi:MAG: hypothetical protein M3Y65_16880 [Pseudomonadota bacterium]|nr:hypothetical protein [Pseudomonadota bacterium]
MIHLHMTPAVSNIRAYDQPNGYENRIPYLGILTVMHLTETTVYLMGAIGTINRETRTKAFDMLRERGITTVIVERHGQMKTISI